MRTAASEASRKRNAVNYGCCDGSCETRARVGETRSNVGSAERDSRVPVRPRRRADADRARARRRLEGDVRRRSCATAPRRRASLRALRRRARLRRVRRRQAPRRRGALVPRLARDRAARGRPRTTRPDAETVIGLGNRKNELVLSLIRRRRRRGVRGLRALRRAARDAGLPPRRRLRRARTAATSSSRPASSDLFEARDRRRSSPSAST